MCERPCLDLCLRVGCCTCLTESDRSSARIPRIQTRRHAGRQAGGNHGPRPGSGPGGADLGIPLGVSLHAINPHRTHFSDFVHSLPRGLFVSLLISVSPKLDGLGISASPRSRTGTANTCDWPVLMSESRGGGPGATSHPWTCHLLCFCSSLLALLVPVLVLAIIINLLLLSPLPTPFPSRCSVGVHTRRLSPSCIRLARVPNNNTMSGVQATPGKRGAKRTL